MGLFERLGTVLKSNINDLISKAEDPEKMINQMLIDMQEQFNEAKGEVANAITHEKGLEKKMLEHQKEAEHWAAKAELAVKKDDDALAIEALKRKKDSSDLKDKYELQFSNQKSTTDKLRTSLKELQEKIDDARRQKDILIARAESAKAQDRIQKVSNSLNSTSAFDTMDRMKHKIDEMESRADANSELNDVLNNKDLDSRFDALERNSGLDDELAALKQKMNEEG